MRKALVILVLAFCSAPGAAASSAHCDAAPFTLGKPAMTTATSDQPKPEPKAAPAAAKKPQPKPANKQRLLASCKTGKSKKKSG